MISVVVPALNEEAYLPSCLESLQKQVYNDKFEIVVVDNNSRDRTAAVARKFKVKVVRCERVGITAARQAGADAASGEIIVQADADTLYPPDWLTRIANHFSDPNVVAVGGNYSYREQFVGAKAAWAKAEFGLRNFVNFVSGRIFQKPPFISGANFAFRKDAFVKIGGYKEGSFYPDQFDLANRLGRLGEVVADSKLTVKTSSRRINKSVAMLLRDTLVNFFTALIHFFSFITGRVPRPVIRTSIRLSPIILIAGLLVYGYFIPTSEVFGKVYDKAETSDKVIALTFDDGPNEPYTSQILDILKAHNIKASFFVIGENVQRYPDTVKRIVAEGNVLGDHSYFHNANHALTMEGCQDLKIAQKIINETTGLDPALYRPPHGKKSPWELDCVKDEGMAEIMWTDSANELNKYVFFGKPSPEAVAQSIIRKAGPGKIIDLHDGYGTCHNCSRSDKSVTVEALPLIIEGLQKEGYRFLTVPELVNISAYNNGSEEHV